MSTQRYQQFILKETKIPSGKSPHEELLGITWVSNPATRKDLPGRTWSVFWLKSKIQVLFEIMVQNKQKGAQGSKTRLQEVSRAACRQDTAHVKHYIWHLIF